MYIHALSGVGFEEKVFSPIPSAAFVGKYYYEVSRSFFPRINDLHMECSDLYPLEINFYATLYVLLVKNSPMKSSVSVRVHADVLLVRCRETCNVNDNNYCHVYDC